MPKCLFSGAAVETLPMAVNQSRLIHSVPFEVPGKKLGEFAVSYGEMDKIIRAAGIEGKSASAVGQYFNNVPKSYRFRAEFFEQPIKWTSPVETFQTYEVFKRRDIVWEQIRVGGDKNFIGKTNLEAAKKGLPPQLPNGNFATLHHMGQKGKGPLTEASTKYHGVGKEGQDILHGQFGKRKPHPENPVDRVNFPIDTRNYWKERVKSYEQ